MVEGCFYCTVFAMCDVEILEYVYYLEVAVIARGEASQNMETDDTINDSQMMSQEESFVEGEGGNDEDSDTDSSHSQETEGSGAEEEDDMEENDEDEGEEDEDDDDDDDDAGSDVYDDDHQHHIVFISQ